MKYESWKTIKLGTGLKTAADFRYVMRRRGFQLSCWASDILGKPAFRVADEETEIDLVEVTVAELGFKEGARRDQIYRRAQERGLELCPAEVGPQLRLQYHDQPRGEWILVAMEPIIASDGGSRIFGLKRTGSEMYLYSHQSSPDDFWDADLQWVFCRPRK